MKTFFRINSPMNRPITLVRRVIQISCFVFIVFGACFGLKKQNIKFLPFIEAPREYKVYREESKTVVVSGPDYPQAFNIFLPIKSCRFLRQTGTFRACFAHFISESIGWLTPLKVVIPHVLFFLISAFLFGRLWCGWVCPLGFIQDILNFIRKSLKFNPIFFSDIVQIILKKICYILFIAIIIFSIISAIPAFPWSVRKQVYLSICQMCPSRYIFPYIGKWPIVHTFLPIGYGVFTSISVFFTLLLIISFFVKRSWCRVCPSGFLLSFFNRGGLLSKEKDILKCIRCGTCVQVCPFQNENIYLARLPERNGKHERKKINVDYTKCIHCFRCIDCCPEKNCLEVKFIGIKLFSS